MKKNDLILISSVAVYSYLFYNQSAGINFLLFTLFLTWLLVVQKGIYKTLFQMPWWYAMAGSLISAICIVLYGNTLSVIANVVSLSLLTALSVEKSSSLLFAGIYSLYSYLSAIAFMFVDWATKYSTKEPGEKKKGITFFIILIPLIVSLVFFFLYREANPLFKNFTASIRFDFITWEWVRFTITGFILLYGFFYHRTIGMLVNKDLRARNNLLSQNFSEHENILWGFKVELSNESMTAIVLFSLLNILLFVVNILDFNYVWLNQSLPEGLNYSESVHQGIGTLITSIVLAVLIILVFFRGNLNFHASGKTVKILAYIWVLQNAFMILSTALRNQLYISEYSLTYKRIGVYVYLLLALIGLVTTLVKIGASKSNWYLFRSNGWLFYGVLVFSCFINWDRMISSFNLEHSKTIDRDYLVSLSTSNTDQLLNSPFLHPDSVGILSSTLNNLHIKTYRFMKSYKEKEWQSWNSEDDLIYDAILDMEKKGKINSLYLSGTDVSSLTPLQEFKNIKKLDLTRTKFDSISEIQSFSKIEELNLTDNGIKSIQKFPVLKNLSSLNLSNNNLKDFTPVRLLPKLEHLDLSYNKNENLTKLPVLPNLKTLNLSGNELGDLSILTGFKNLQTLQLNSTHKVYLETLPALPMLKELEVYSISLSGEDLKSVLAIASQTGLKKLNVSSNSFSNFYLAPQELYRLKKQKSTLQDLVPSIPGSVEELTISYNKIITTDGIQHLKNLNYLDASSNELNNLGGLKELSTLERLNLTGNKIANIAPLSSLTNLQELYLGNNLVFNIQAIKNSTKLISLDLSGNQLTDIHDLKQLKNLSYLNLANNPGIKDLSILANLTSLRELNITSCQVSDLSFLFALKNLRKLHCYGLDPSKIEELKRRLPALEINDYTYTPTLSPATL